MSEEKLGLDDYLLATNGAKLKKVIADATPAEQYYRLLTGEELCKEPPMAWLLHEVLPREGIGVLYGASSAGKGFLAISLAHAVAGGATHWFGLHIMQASVTYLCLEGAAGLGKRMMAAKKYSGRKLPDALRFISRQSFGLLSDDVDKLAAAIHAAGGAGGMVIIDTLHCATVGMDENSNQDMGLAIEAAKHLQTLVGGLILLVHHTGKDEEKGIRGASSLTAALDGAIKVTRKDIPNSPITERAWINTKAKDSIDGREFPFRLRIVEVGKDALKFPITSCVVELDTHTSRKQSKAEMDADTMLAHIRAELAKGNRYSQRALAREAPPKGMGRRRAEAALTLLFDAGRVEEPDKDSAGVVGGSHIYVRPVDGQNVPSNVPSITKKGNKKEKF